MRHAVILVVFLGALAACAGAPDRRYGDVVSVQYDPNRFQMDRLQRAAEAQCRAKGFARAEPLENEPNAESVRWSYLTFGCFEG